MKRNKKLNGFSILKFSKQLEPFSKYKNWEMKVKKNKGNVSITDSSSL